MGNPQNANFIREERTRAGVTLEKLAAKTGIPVSTLGRYQNSEDVPTSALQKIADALDVPMSALLVRRETPDGDKLSYDQLCLQLQQTQQVLIYKCMRFDSLRRAHRWASTLVLVLLVFITYIFIDRFAFPDAGLFHAGG